MIRKSYLVGMVITFGALALLIGLMPGTKASADPSAKSTFVGTDTCANCHPDVAKSLSKTAHAAKTRPATAKTLKPMPLDNKIKTIDDKVMFKLRKKGNKKVYLHLYNLDGTGETVYRVNRVMGGTGVAGKLRLVLIFDKDGNNVDADVKDSTGMTHVISPVQFNHLDKARGGTKGKDTAFNVYHAEHWYGDGISESQDAFLKTNILKLPSGTLSQPQFNNSWERRCVGCHATGPDITYNKKTGFFGNNSSEYNVGCEACHGPGSAHAASMDAADILNPDDLQYERATEVCARCHIRGSDATAGKGRFSTGYPSKVKSNGKEKFPTAGDTLAEWYTNGEGLWNSNAEQWGNVASEQPMSRSHHQQGFDWTYRDAEGNAVNAHYGDKPWQKKTCWECHNPHNKGVEGAQLIMKASNNALCLSCHADHGFEDDQAIMDHTGHSIGASTCVECHMPVTAKSQGKWNANGGDIHSHAFEVINPNLTQKMAKKQKGGVIDGKAIPNGCYYCHSNDDDFSADRWDRWKAAGFPMGDH